MTYVKSGRRTPPETLLTFKFADQILPPKYGSPMKLRMPIKLGFKNPKHISAMFVTNRYPGGYWEDKGYNWFRSYRQILCTTG